MRERVAREGREAFVEPRRLTAVAVGVASSAPGGTSSLMPNSPLRRGERRAARLWVSRTRQPEAISGNQWQSEAIMRFWVSRTRPGHRRKVGIPGTINGRIENV